MGGPDVKERHDLRSRLQVSNKDIKYFRWIQKICSKGIFVGWVTCKYLHIWDKNLVNFELYSFYSQIIPNIEKNEL